MNENNLFLVIATEKFTHEAAEIYTKAHYEVTLYLSQWMRSVYETLLFFTRN